MNERNERNERKIDINITFYYITIRIRRDDRSEAYGRQHSR